MRLGLLYEASSSLDQHRKQIEKLLGQGMSMPKAAAELKVNRSTLVAYVRRHGIEQKYVPPPHPLDSKHDEIKKMAAKGMGPVAIAGKLGVSYKTLYKYAQKHIPELKQPVVKDYHDQVMDMYSKDRPVAEIAGKIGFSAGAVYNYLKGQGIDNRLGIDPDVDEMVDLLSQGLFASEIAEKIDASKSQVEWWLRNHREIIPSNYKKLLNKRKGRKSGDAKIADLMRHKAEIVRRMESGEKLITISTDLKLNYQRLAKFIEREELHPENWTTNAKDKLEFDFHERDGIYYAYRPEKGRESVAKDMARWLKSQAANKHITLVDDAVEAMLDTQQDFNLVVHPESRSSLPYAIADRFASVLDIENIKFRKTRPNIRGSRRKHAVEMLKKLSSSIGDAGRPKNPPKPIFVVGSSDGFTDEWWKGMDAIDKRVQSDIANIAKADASNLNSKQIPAKSIMGLAKRRASDYVKLKLGSLIKFAPTLNVDADGHINIPEASLHIFITLPLIYHIANLYIDELRDMGIVKRRGGRPRGGTLRRAQHILTNHRSISRQLVSMATGYGSKRNKSYRASNARDRVVRLMIRDTSAEPKYIEALKRIDKPHINILLVDDDVMTGATFELMAESLGNIAESLNKSTTFVKFALFDLPTRASERQHSLSSLHMDTP